MKNTIRYVIPTKPPIEVIIYKSPKTKPLLDRFKNILLDCLNLLPKDDMLNFNLTLLQQRRIKDYPTKIAKKI